ncbi:MAG TPA: D-glycerate dehydrogenase [Terriglobia bacterium]|nr:D-glycerate dehydrogenase [Terriglobia bacterium]
MKPKVFATRPLPTPVLDLLAAQADLSFNRDDRALPTAQLAVACRDVDGILVSGTKISRDVLDPAARLRIVANCGVGYDNIDVAACTRRRIPVTNTAGSLEETTADLAFALLMAVARRIVEGDRYVRDGRWKQWEWKLLWGADIYGKTLGIYGFGRIGQAVARRGRGFGMSILYTGRHRAPEAVERELEAELVNRETLFRQSDFLSLHVPLTPETLHLVAAHELDLMKPTAFLINTARGKVVDEEALVQALSSGKLAGAGLDVFEQEPQVHPALIAMPNVVLMPHVGSATHETRLRMATVAAENLLAALEGRRPPNVVNPEVYWQSDEPAQ